MLKEKDFCQNIWTNTLLLSDPVNMQPDKTKYHTKRPITSNGLQHAVSSYWKPLRIMGSYYYIRKGTAVNWSSRFDVIQATKWQVLYCDVLSHDIWGNLSKMWWFIEIDEHFVVYRVFAGYYEQSSDWRLCRCHVIVGYFWIRYQY